MAYIEQHFNDVEDNDLSELDRAAGGQKACKRSKLYFDSDNEHSESKGGKGSIFPADGSTSKLLELMKRWGIHQRILQCPVLYLE